MPTFTITINKSIIEFFGFSAVYIRIGHFERFYGSDVTTRTNPPPSPSRSVLVP